MIAAAALWATALVIISTSGPLDRLGQLKGRDFAFFYTLGHLVNTGQGWRMYDMDAEHDVRARIVPASAADAFASAYPPQTALIFSPFARLPYGLALAVWMLCTAAIYFAGVVIALRRGGLDPVLVIGAAAAFPPFWNLMLGGQSTALPLLGLTMGWLALEHGARFTAGLALGLLAIKPQLGLVLVAVALWHREGRIVAGAAISIGVQFGLAWLVLGSDVVLRYVHVIADAGRLRQLLQPHAYQVQSVQALADLLPVSWRFPAWMAGASVMVVIAVRTWTRPVPLPLRVAVVILASVLASPHLLVYDVTLIALPLIWIGAALDKDAHAFAGFAALCYLAFVTLLLPTAGAIGLQLSVVTLIALLLWTVWSQRATPKLANQ